MSWRVGQRVCRKDDVKEIGTVTEKDGQSIKVKWDNGRTSYYRRSDTPPLSGYTDPPELALVYCEERRHEYYF